MFRLSKVALAIAVSVLLFPVAAAAQAVYVQEDGGQLAQPTLPPQSVLLTFDDGPSPYTSEILAILKEKGVKATFFVVGKEAVAYPGVLQQIYDDGHDIANHTYSHPNLATEPDWRVRMELSLTRIVIASQIDRTTRMFRPPLLGSDSLTPDMQSVIHKAAGLGYITVGETIDTQDWRKPDPAELTANASKGGGIILLHDGGGDRSRTVKALLGIIDYYKQQGYTFMTVSQALGVPQQETMPLLTLTDRILAALALVVIWVSQWLGLAMKGLIIVLIVASFGRFVFVFVAALIQSRRKRPMSFQTQPFVSVIIPAYNESAVIASCLKSVLASRYQKFEVLVIDDGSKDDTFSIASSIVDPRLRVLKKANGGKASALNYGIEAATAPFVVAIDADTVFRPLTLMNLMRHFSDRKVAAVSGNTKIVNRHTLLTKLQSLEYIVGFNLDRRMGDLFDCITVVPGAVGAFRKSVLQEVGGFTFDTLAEDTDVTLAIKEAGYTIIYDAEAVALTEAPATVRDLLKQRFRWTFGTMQAVWKHKSAFMNPRRGSLGMIGLPYLLWYQIVFPLFAPLFDIALVVGLLNHQYGLMVTSFVVYTVVDVITASTALLLDGEKLRNLWILIPQRILYRQLMYYVIVRSFIFVLKGRLVHWGNLERKGTHLASNV